MQLSETLADLEHLKEKSPIWYALCVPISALIGDFSTAGYYKECLQMAASMLDSHRPNLQQVHERRKSSNTDVLDRAIARAEDTSRWAQRMADEGYHTMFCHVFLSLWAVQESGIENLVAAMIQHNRQAAEVATTKINAGKVERLASWPWSAQACRDAASALEKLACNASRNSEKRVDTFKSIEILLGWFGMRIDVPDDKAADFNEANSVRNILLHQYGNVTDKDMMRYPSLASSPGGRIVMSGERLHRYHGAVVAVFQQLLLNFNKSPCSRSA